MGTALINVFGGGSVWPFPPDPTFPTTPGLYAWNGTQGWIPWDLILPSATPGGIYVWDGDTQQWIPYIAGSSAELPTLPGLWAWNSDYECWMRIGER